MLGDNIFYGAGFTKLLKNAVKDAEKNNKATVFGYWVSDPERYGVAEFDRQGNCLSIDKRQGLKVACLEGIAYRRGWISEERMHELAKPMLKNQYGQYLLK